MYIDTSTGLFKIAAMSGGFSVLLGAFGAHGLQKTVHDPKLLDIWKTASYYHLIHSGVMLICSGGKMALPGALIASGTVVFSGSLYLLVLTGQKWLGAITPIGGLLLAGGWFSMLLQ